MSVTIAPPLFFQQFNPNNSGSPAIGYKLFTYAAGTTTKQATYTDSTEGTENSNPIVLDANGGANVWGDPTLGYKLVWAPANDTDPPTSPIRTVDNVYFPLTIEQITQTLIATLLWPQTVAEKTASADPVNLWIPSHDGCGKIIPDRYATNTEPGTTDMTSALQAAIAVAQALGQAVIKTLPYEYLTDTLELVSGTTLDLTGSKLFFKAHTTTHNPVIRMGTESDAQPRCRLIGGEIDGNAANQTYADEEWSPGVWIWGSDYCDVIGVQIHDVQGDGVTVGYDLGRVVGSNGCTIQNCEIYAVNTSRQAIAITYGDENRLLYNRCSGTIDLELDASTGECKNNLVHGNRGRTQTESDDAPRTSDLAISLASENTDSARYYGNTISENHCYSIVLEYNQRTIIRGNLVVGSTDTQSYLVDIAAGDDTLMQGNILDVNGTVATAMVAALRTRGCAGLLVTDNTVKGDSSGVPFHSYISSFSTNDAANHFFRNNRTDSGYYRGADCLQASEWARFRLDNAAGTLTLTQIAGVTCHASAPSHSAHLAVLGAFGNAGSKWLLRVDGAGNNTTSGTNDCNAKIASTVSSSGSNKSVGAWAWTPSAASASYSLFDFAASGSTGAILLDVWF